MNTSQLTERLSLQLGTSQADAKLIVAALFDAGSGIIPTELSDGGEVAIAGFGKFGVSHRKARVGRNPQTGAELQIAAKTVPLFKAAKGLKDSVA